MYLSKYFTFQWYIYNSIYIVYIHIYITHGLIAQSITASERNLMVVGSNLTQANFQNIIYIHVIYIYIYIRIYIYMVIIKYSHFPSWLLILLGNHGTKGTNHILHNVSAFAFFWCIFLTNNLSRIYNSTIFPS